MGVLRDQIQAIRTNGALTENEKRAQVYQLKCDALFDLLANGTGPVQKFIGRTFTYNATDITVTAAAVEGDPARLLMHVVLTRGGITKAGDVIVENPPILASDGTEDLAKVAGEMLSSFYDIW